MTGDIAYLGRALLFLPPLVEGPESHYFHHLADEVFLHDGLQLFDNHHEHAVHRGFVRVFFLRLIAGWWHRRVKLGHAG